MPLGILGPGKATKGNDPQARRPAVSRGHTRRCRSGSTTLASPELLQHNGGPCVRCDVPLTSYRGPNHVLHPQGRTARRTCLLASSFLAPLFPWDFRRARTAIGIDQQLAAHRGQLRPGTRTAPAPSLSPMKVPERAASRRIAHRPTNPRARRRGPAGTTSASQGDGQGGRPKPRPGTFPASSAQPRPSSPRKRSRIRRRKRCKRSSPRRRACS